MNAASVMINSQESTSVAWTLAPGQVRNLTIGPGQRWLHVVEGRLWLTLPGSLDEPAEDLWLQAGDGVALPEGSRVLIEGWPSARFELLVPPQACGRGWLGRVSARLASRLPPPAASGLPHAA